MPEEQGPKNLSANGLSERPAAAAISETCPETDRHGGSVSFRNDFAEDPRDLSCGGSWLDAKPGDRIEIKSEYVHPARGRDLLHFTHAADGRCAGAAAHPDGYIRPAPLDLAAAAGDLFQAVIRPVLARRCLCHQKGGKMYERLPFDDPTVVSSHADGVRRRLKGDDLAAIENWLKALQASGS